MQSPMANEQLINLPDLAFAEAEITTGRLEWLVEQDPFFFQTYFEGYMDMYSDSQRVAEYLEAHQEWFCRCAQPMKVEPIETHGYTLTIGRFGSFGYEVEPKISVVLQPPKDGMYLMYTVPVPDYTPAGYQVDYRASMELREIPLEAAALEMAAAYKKKGHSSLPPAIARINWQLHLRVAVWFPKFIYKLPTSLIQRTGDRLLAQIVRQISPRLSYKVQQDFHSRFDLPIPPKSAIKLHKLDPTEVR